MACSDFLCLRVNVPICSFRKGWAREFLETEDVPPPSTVFGFLLSLAGEEDREQWAGVRLAYGRLCRPERSTVLRTVWRVKDAKVPPGVGENRRPDFQELLTGVSLGIWVQSASLIPRLTLALTSPAAIIREGGLSMGESRDLVNEVVLDPDLGGRQLDWVTPESTGNLSLPTWVDHVGSAGTVLRQFRLIPAPWEIRDQEDSRWITIEPPELKTTTSASPKVARTRKKPQGG